MTEEIKKIIADSSAQGWVLEPDAMRILNLGGVETPRFCYALTADEAIAFAQSTGYPLAAKVVSPAIMHKSDVGGVAINIADDRELAGHFARFSRMEEFRGMMVEEMVAGLELIVGAKLDPQFGPVVLLGLGGTGVEIYKDTTIRMAPLVAADVEAMVKRLRAHKVLEGYRGKPAVNMSELTRLLIAFSELIMRLEPYFESIDLNPVLCSPERCLVADARIVLKA